MPKINMSQFASALCTLQVHTHQTFKPGVTFRGKEGVQKLLVIHLEG